MIVNTNVVHAQLVIFQLKVVLFGFGAGGVDIRKLDENVQLTQAFNLYIFINLAESNVSILSKNNNFNSYFSSQHLSLNALTYLFFVKSISMRIRFVKNSQLPKNMADKETLEKIIYDLILHIAFRYRKVASSNASRFVTRLDFQHTQIDNFLI